MKEYYMTNDIRNTSNKPYKPIQKMRDEITSLKSSINDRTFTKNGIEGSKSTDLQLAYISLIKDAEIKTFISDLDKKDGIPLLEDYESEYQTKLIKALDNHKDPKKILAEQQKILEEQADKAIEYVERISGVLMQSGINKMKKLNKIKEKIESVDRYNEFFTPPEIATELFKHSINIKKNESIRCLEPTAGFGSLVSAILEERQKYENEGIKIDMIEINEPNRLVLEKLVLKDKSQLNLLEQKNFLKVPDVAEYDLIVMNPPFHLKHQYNRATIDKDMYDIDFVMKAYDMLKDGGELLAITSSYLSHGKAYANKFIKDKNVEVVQEYRNYKWSATKEKEEKGKKSTKLNLNFDLIRIVKPKKEEPKRKKSRVEINEYTHDKYLKSKKK